jgi:hypothetical protein
MDFKTKYHKDCLCLMELKAIQSVFYDIGKKVKVKAVCGSYSTAAF